LANFHIEGRLKHLPDPQRSFNWEIDIMDGDSPLDTLKDVGDLKFRVKSINTPQRNIETIDTWFYGLKQSIPGRTTFSNQVNMLIEEGEDQYVLRSIYDWMEKITSVNHKNPFGTLSSSKKISKNMYIRMLKYNGDYEPYALKLANVYPLSINDVPLDYMSNESLKYDVAFNFDYWVLEKI
jgi:hypothetical protein